MTEFHPLPLDADSVPSAICPACAAGAVVHVASHVAVAYCSHSLAGAFMPPGRNWSVVRGIEGRNFRDAVARALVQVELRRDVTRDLALIFSAAAGNKGGH